MNHDKPSMLKALAFYQGFWDIAWMLGPQPLVSLIEAVAAIFGHKYFDFLGPLPDYTHKKLDMEPMAPTIFLA